jgi:hypothetical protein
MSHRHVDLFRVTLGAPDEKKQSLAIRLDFGASSHDESIEFRVDYHDFAFLIQELQKHQVQYKIPIPPNLRPQGPPALSIVSDD